MSFVQSKYKSLGQIVEILFSLWLCKHFLINHILVGLKNKFYLCWVNYGAIEFLFGVVLRISAGEGLNLSCIAGNLLQFVANTNCTSLLGFLCFDTIHPTTNINPIYNGFFQSIVNNNITIEECLGSWNRSCCQAYNTRSVEVFENLFPVAVD